MVGVTLTQRVAAQIAPPERQAMAIQLVGAGISMLAILVLARGFGAALAGYYAVVSQTVLFAGAAALFGYDQALTRAVSSQLALESRAQAMAALRYYGLRVLAGVTIAALALSLASPWFAQLGYPDLPLWYLPLAMLAFVVLRMAASGLRGAMHLRTSQCLLVAQPLVLLVLILAAWRADSVESFAPLGTAYLVSLGMAGVMACAGLYWMARGWGGQPAERFASKAPDAWSMGLAGLIIALINWMEIAALGYWADPAAMGVFRICVQVILPINLIYTAFAFSVSPHYAQLLAKDQYRAVWAKFRSDRRFLLVIGAPVAALLILFADPVLGFLGEEFRAGYWPLIIMASALILNLFTATSGIMLTMAHREDVFRKLTIASLFVSAACIVLLVPHYGMLGAAISVALGVVIREGGAYIAAHRIIPNPDSSGDD